MYTTHKIEFKPVSGGNMRYYYYYFIFLLWWAAVSTLPLLGLTSGSNVDIDNPPGRYKSNKMSHAGQLPGSIFLRCLPFLLLRGRGERGGSDGTKYEAHLILEHFSPSKSINFIIDE